MRPEMRTLKMKSLMDVNKEETDVSEEGLNFTIAEEFPPVYSQ